MRLTTAAAVDPYRGCLRISARDLSVSRRRWIVVNTELAEEAGFELLVLNQSSSAV
jgi:hypothetical protein